LFHWNTKLKKNNGLPEDDIPRLICVSARTDEGVNSILSDFKSRICDAEHAYLIHQAFRKPFPNHIRRGYGIYDKNGDVTGLPTQVDIRNQKLCLVFGHFDKEWLKLGPALMKIPIFAKTIKSIQDIIREAGDATVIGNMSKVKEGSLINQILGTVAVQISLINILKEIKLPMFRIIGIGSGEIVAAYADGFLTLKQAVLGLLDIANNLTKPRDWDRLQKIFPSGKKRYEKWTPIHEEKLRQNSAKYFAENIIVSNNGKDIKRLFPKDAVSLVIGPSVKATSKNRIDLIDTESKDYILDFLTSLGRLYQCGFDMELDKLYPQIELPVSRGTPMLSPLIKWNHEKDHKVYLYQNEAEIKSEHRMMHIMPKADDWSFVVGHSIDGRNLFPATGYLVLAWQSLAMASHKLSSEMKVVFEDVRYIRAANVPKTGLLELIVTIQVGAKTFEIADGGVSIVTGRIYEMEEPPVFWDIPTSEEGEENELCLTEKDVYT
ncbi:hypothetical protein AMK59_4681, partial [Oryctes borbonicus]